MSQLRFREKLPNGMFHYWGIMSGGHFEFRGPTHPSSQHERYIGHNDVNGTEMYEGDIFVAEQYPFFSDDPTYNYVGVIIFEHFAWGYDLYCVNPELRGSACGGGFEDIADDVLTVIGNIHQNPELLES